MHTQTCFSKRGRQPSETRTVWVEREPDLPLDDENEDLVESGSRNS